MAPARLPAPVAGHDKPPWFAAPEAHVACKPLGQVNAVGQRLVRVQVFGTVFPAANMVSLDLPAAETPRSVLAQRHLIRLLLFSIAPPPAPPPSLFFFSHPPPPPPPHTHTQDSYG